MKKIPTEAVARIVLEIGGWNGRRHPTWSDVRDLAAPICGRDVSRQWLCTTREIKEAYEERREAYRDSGAEGWRSSPRARPVRSTVAELRLELAARDRKLAEYDDTLARMLDAVRRRGINIAEIIAPLRPLRT